MAPQRLEKIESAPGNGMGSEASNPQDLVPGRATDRTQLRLTKRKNDKVAKLQKKAPKALKSLDAELKSAPVPGEARGELPSRGVDCEQWAGRPSAVPVAQPEKRMDRTTGREIFLPARP